MTVSSAYCDITYVLLFISIPLIFVLFFILIASISAHKRNIYGEIGSPCLQPRSSLKKFDNIPACDTQDTAFF